MTQTAPSNLGSIPPPSISIKNLPEDEDQPDNVGQAADSNVVSVNLISPVFYNKTLYRMMRISRGTFRDVGLL